MMSLRSHESTKTEAHRVIKTISSITDREPWRATWLPCRPVATDKASSVKTNRSIFTLRLRWLVFALPLSMCSNRLRRWFGAVFLGVAIVACAGCQRLAPPQQQQLEAAEEMHRDVNPEFAEAAEDVGTLQSRRMGNFWRSPRWIRSST